MRVAIVRLRKKRDNQPPREPALRKSKSSHRNPPAVLDPLQAFIDVARQGTFSAVAKSRNVAVSSVARQVDALEASLGIRLFHRSSRRLLLTDAGEQFLPRAEGLVEDLDDAKAALLDAQAEPSACCPSPRQQRLAGGTWPRPRPRSCSSTP